MNLTLTAAQANHLAKRKWTLVAQPTEPCPDRRHPAPIGGERWHGGCDNGLVPVPATVTCVECHGTGRADVRGAPPCLECKGKGTLPLTVEVEWAANPDDAEVEDEGCPAAYAAVPLGSATVTEVPVVDDYDAACSTYSGPTAVEVTPNGTVLLYEEWDSATEDEGADVIDLFDSAPEPGSTVWLLTAKETS